jgi:uncharacterized protein YfaS (alpha-2-macroglobulin family)
VALKDDGSGEAAFEFDIPQFSGEVRLMAVAYKNESFGSGESKMTVADPIVLSTALPRFLSPGDSISVPVIVTNTTAKTATAHAELKTSGSVQFSGNNQQTVDIPANSEGRLMFNVANPALGAGKILVEVNSMEKNLLTRSVCDRHHLTNHRQGSVNGGSMQTLPLKANDFIPR